VDIVLVALDPLDTSTVFAESKVLLVLASRDMFVPTSELDKIVLEVVRIDMMNS
jgi:hypothetical protein